MAAESPSPAGPPRPSTNASFESRAGQVFEFGPAPIFSREEGQLLAQGPRPADPAAGNKPAAGKPAQNKPAPSDPAGSRSKPSTGNAGRNKPANRAAAREPSKPLSRDWSTLFAGDPPDRQTIQDLISSLSANNQWLDVASLIENAIRKGQIQPWMYEVLALAMERVGRPADEIERVLLSGQDLINSDAASTLYLAAHLARHGREEQAIKLCYQASLQEPTRPEPYILALELAEATHQPEAVVWAAPGTLLYAWGKAHAAQHRKAEQQAQEAREQLLRDGRFDLAVELERNLERARVKDLQIRLEWNGDGDLDLLVTEPKGTVCSAQTPYSQEGGIFTHDGHGPKQEDCYDEYLCPIAFSGDYQIAVRHVYGEIVAKRARLRITRFQGTSREETVVHPVAIGVQDQIVRLSLKGGRRTVLADLPAPRINLAKGAPNHHVLAQVGVGGGGGVGAQVGAIPRVGGGAVGYQPVVSVIPDGVFMSALAVVSADRRYVRLSLNPTITNIVDVFTFDTGINGGGGGVGGGGGNTGAGGGAGAGGGGGAGGIN